MRPPPTEEVHAMRRRWLMLALGTAAQTAACAFVYGIPYLAAELRDSGHLSLPRIGLLIACPTVGLVAALVAWGALADRHGERIVIATGLGGAGALLAVTAAVTAAGGGTVALGALLFLAGAAAASVYSASGRLVMGWFTARERGLAMGIRQTSTPLGMGVAALTMPPLAAAYGIGGAFGFLATVCALIAAAVAVLAADPARPEAAGAAGAAAEPATNPYRGSSTLWRIHGAGALLVVPQFTAGAFALVLLVDTRGWTAVDAGRLIAVAQVLGAASRIAAGRWSDRVGSRLLPMRQLAVVTAAVVAVAAFTAAFPSPLTAAALVLSVGITASTNGLSFTATAERAGPAWSGRALGVHNTGQNFTAAVVPPLSAAAISATGYWPALAAAAAVACGAAMVVPVDSPRRRAVVSSVP
ncbi:MFS transporter [Streptomyces sp. NPDC002574]|uniref:MFS transporter n=1 Tax=Streptomyces sp. NPDC002574 TaxID=3364652 RepID=UPI0036A9E0D3